MTKHKMVAAVKDKIRRLHEDKIIAELTKGIYVYTHTGISSNSASLRHKLAACDV